MHGSRPPEPTVAVALAGELRTLYEPIVLDSLRSNLLTPLRAAGPHQMHAHAVQLALGALRIPRTMCGAGAPTCSWT